MNCRLCSAPISEPFSMAEIFNQNVDYFECVACGYVQTENPSWLDKAYASPINPSDTGIMVRNLSNVGLVLATLMLLGERPGKVVDFAGGFGFLVRMLRDQGVNAFWLDPYTENLVARGFEYSDKDDVSLVTAFESFEHFVNPIEEMEKLLSISPNILFTTSLIPQPTPKPSEWWYYGLDHGQHIGFFRTESLRYLADKFGLQLLSDGGHAHLLTRKKVSLIKWRFLRYFARHFPTSFAIGLSPKTWSDHLKIAEIRRKLNKRV